MALGITILGAVSMEGAGEWSPNGLENRGLVLSQWGSIPPPSSNQMPE